MRGSTEAERSTLGSGIKGCNFELIAGFSDGHKFTAPVGSYPVNGLGIHDLGGNVMEWNEDMGEFGRVFRGGCWTLSDRRELASSNLMSTTIADRLENLGFRCVMER